MDIEIEAKLKIDSPRQVMTKLNQLGAEFIEEQLQKDFYFDDSQAALTKADKCLRLRSQLTGSEKKIFLTYKGPKETVELKRRQEIELQVDNIDTAAKLLLAIGYRESLVVEKRRQLWRLDDCYVAIDTLPKLGSFVEIEGPGEKQITEVQKKLALAKLKHIKDSYAHIMQKTSRH